MKKRITILVILVLTIFTACSCTAKQKKDYVEDYGWVQYCDAYRMKKNISYNLYEISELRYYRPAKKAIDSVNKSIKTIVPYKFSYFESKNKSENNFYYADKSTTIASANAINSISYNTLLHTVVSSNITIYEDFVQDFTEEEITVIYIHEVSHTLGLCDLYDVDSKSYFARTSIMYGYDDAFYYADYPKELTEFDLYHLKEMY